MASTKGAIIYPCPRLRGCLPACLPACALQPYTCSLQRAVLKQWRQVHRIYRPPAPGYSMWCDGALAGRWVGGNTKIHRYG